MHRLTSSALDGVLLVPRQPDAAVPVLLRHSSDEPEAVRVVLVIDDDTSVEWLLDRAVLAHSGRNGQVTVTVRSRRVHVAVGALATLVLPLDGVVEFLCAAYSAAPTGWVAPRAVLTGA